MSNTDSELRQQLDMILKREQTYVQQCTLANIEAAKTSGQWIIHDPNRRATIDEILALLATQKQRWEAAARKDELINFNPLFKGDHSKCPDSRTCIGYQNAQSDFDNEKELRLSALDGVMGKDGTVQ